MTNLCRFTLIYFSLAFTFHLNSASGEGMFDSEFNIHVLDAIKEMPSHGGYAVTKAAGDALRSATLIENGSLVIQGERAQPSFCSGATYFVLLKSLQPEIEKIDNLDTKKATIEKLLVRNQADGI